MFYKLRIIDKEQSVNRKQNVNIIFNEINNKNKALLKMSKASKMSASTYFPGRLPAKYFRH